MVNISGTASPDSLKIKPEPGHASPLINVQSPGSCCVSSNETNFNPQVYPSQPAPSCCPTTAPVGKPPGTAAIPSNIIVFSSPISAVMYSNI